MWRQPEGLSGRRGSQMAAPGQRMRGAVQNAAISNALKPGAGQGEDGQVIGQRPDVSGPQMPPLSPAPAGDPTPGVAPGMEPMHSQVTPDAPEMRSPGRTAPPPQSVIPPSPLQPVGASAPQRQTPSASGGMATPTAPGTATTPPPTTDPPAIWPLPTGPGTPGGVTPPNTPTTWPQPMWQKGEIKGSLRQGGDFARLGGGFGAADTDSLKHTFGRIAQNFEVTDAGLQAMMNDPEFRQYFPFASLNKDWIDFGGQIDPYTGTKVGKIDVQHGWVAGGAGKNWQWLTEEDAIAGKQQEAMAGRQRPQGPSNTAQLLAHLQQQLAMQNALKGPV